MVTKGVERKREVRGAFFKFYNKARSLICPSLRYSQYIYEDVVSRHIKNDTEWLDIGCGHNLLSPWRHEEEKKLVRRCKRIVGIDYDTVSLKAHKTIKERIRGDITKLPFRDGSFDIVTANMVVEHLNDPASQFKEIRRVLKPEGLFIFHTPNLLGYVAILSKLVPEGLKAKVIYFLQQRHENDIFPAFYKINTAGAINSMSKETGFDVTKIKMIVSSANFVMFPPLLIPELLWIRLLMTRPFRQLRPNIIAVLKKKDSFCATQIRTSGKSYTEGFQDHAPLVPCIGKERT